MNLSEISTKTLEEWLHKHHNHGDCHKSPMDGCDCEAIKQELRDRIAQEEAACQMK
jgi:hypothetical protein